MTSPAPAPARTAVLDAARQFDSWLAFQQRLARVPGVQAAVLHDDEVVLSSAYGFADLEAGTPLTTSHRFRIASHSKTFTATAVVRLAERGVLHLDDAVSRWLPFLAGSGVAAVTLRELLAHAGGVVRDGWDGDFWQLFRPFPDHDELCRVALDDAAVLPRNQRFKYSNIGYSLLGLVIEAATGVPYGQHVTDELLTPLGLADTAPDLDDATAARLAAGYSALSYGDRRVPIEHVHTGAMASATGFASTAEDVVRWAAAHFLGDERVVSDDAKRQLHKTEWEVEGTGGTGYGLGFASATVGGRRVLGHGGGYPGHITRTFFDPVGRVAVSVLTNAIDGPALGLATGFLRLLELAGQGESSAPSPVDLSRFVGRFASLWGVYDVVPLGGRLYQLDPSQPDPAAAPVQLAVEDERTLRIERSGGYGSPGERLRYEFADDGRVLQVRGGSGTTAAPIDVVAASVTGRDRVRIGDRF
jgi:CubicO group peptidase (beta-lactamase class C family)